MDNYNYGSRIDGSILSHFDNWPFLKSKISKQSLKFPEKRTKDFIQSIE